MCKQEKLLCMLQMMEHLRNTKASVVELQGVRDLLNSKADLTDVNAALSQVCYTSCRMLKPLPSCHSHNLRSLTHDCFVTALF